MAVLRKQSFPENLETFSVLVTDTGDNSVYFKITDLPDTFTGGKNSFLIQGSDELVQDTIVKIEIKDSNGKVIYNEAGQGIPEYFEGTSKPVAVYVYPDTAYGPCTITILGELYEYIDERGIKTSVPLEWKNKYNVRWQKVVNVNPNLTNTSKIRFYRRPKVSITETVLPVYTRNVSRITISGSINGIAVQPTVGSNFRSFRGDTIYYLSVTGSLFSSSMEGETINITGLPQTYNTTIKDVVNSNKLLVTSPYYEVDSNTPTAYQIVKNFENANFTLAYNSNVSLSNSTINASYAKIRLTDLESFSGDPARIKVFTKRKADIGNYSLVDDVRLESNDILIADSYSGSINVNTGQFTNQNLVNDYWSYTDTTGTIYPAYYNNELIAAAVKLEEGGTQNLSEYPQRIFYYKTQLSLNKDTEYELEFTPLLSSSLFQPTKLEIYGSGSAFLDTNLITKLGKKISEYNFNGSSRRYDRQQLIFKPDSDGVGTIVFAIYQGNWHISNISLKASSETNFSPNEITLNVEVPTVVNNDEYEFRFEFYDVNNNYVPINVVTSSVFTGGSTLEDVVGVARFFTVSPDTNVFPFGYLNNYDFQELNTFSSVPLGTKSIFFNIQRSGITGSITFTSAAFDSGGVYINPATYTGQYPGFLTNITTSSATLTVDNFTGSMASTIDVRRIEYTASLEEFKDTISIYKVVEGTPGSDGENGEQYIIKPLNGTAIKNSDPTTYLEVQLVKVFGNAALDIVAGDVKLVTGSSNTIISVGDGIVAGANGVEYNARFYADKINGSLILGAYDFINNRLVDTITLADITDGLTTGFIEATNGLILNRDPNTNTYSPTNTALTASFYDGLGNLYTSSVLVTPNYSAPNDQLKYQTGISNPNINLDFVRTTTGVAMSNNVFTNTTGLTIRYTFTDPYSGGTVAASEGVIVTTNGSSGTSGAAGSSGTAGANGSSGTAGANGKVVQIVIEPPSQTIIRYTDSTYTSPAPFIVRLYEEGNLLTYSTSNPPSSGQWTLQVNSSNGTNNSVNGTTSGSITPTSLSFPMISSSTNFAVRYRTSDGLVTSGFVSQSHNIGVTLEGETGPGVVFTGVWSGDRFYQYGDNNRRDVVLWSSTGNEPFDTYYIVNQDVNPAENPPHLNAKWDSLGTEDFFVAAKIAIFEESFIKNTINVGSSNNGGVSSANITIAGSGSYPYISLGQADQTGSQGYGLPGIFLGAVKDSGQRKFRFSLASGSNYLRWDGTGQLQISGAISASEGRIGGVTLSGDKIYIGTGVWNNPNTDFYVDRTGYFSLEDRLTWDGINKYLNISGTIKAETGSFGGITIGSNKIYTGGGIFADASTGFYADNSGQFSLKDKLTWNGSTLNINGNITVTGGNAATNSNLSSSFNDTLLSSSIAAGNAALSASISGSSSYANSIAQLQILADGGYSGSFIGQTTIYSPNIGGQNGYISNIFKVGSTSFNQIVLDGFNNPRKIYIGVGNYANPDTDFYVGTDGKFSIRDRLTWNGTLLTVSGTINATGGNFTGDITSSATISGSTLLGGTMNIGSGKFTVNADGTLNASGAFLEGEITADSGKIGGWIIGQTQLSSVSSSIRLISEGSSSIQIWSGSTLVVNISDQKTLSSGSAGTISVSPSTSTNNTTDAGANTTTTSTTQTITDLTDLAPSSSVPTTVTVSTTDTYTVSMYLSRSAIWDLSVGFEQGSSTSTYSGHEMYGFVGCYIRSGSEGNTGGQVAKLETGVSLTASGLSWANDTKYYKVGINEFVTTTVPFEASKTYYFVPYFRLARNKITGAITNPKLYRSTGNGVAPTTWDSLVDVYVPILKNIEVVKGVSKSELIGGGFQIIRDTNNFVRMDRLVSGTMLEVGGAITATGNITAYSSDARLKKNIIVISDPLDKIEKISGVHYEWIDEVHSIGFTPHQKTDTGVLAQEIYEVLPDAVKPAPFDSNADGSSKSGQKYLTVQYEKIVPLLIEAIKELRKEIILLKNKLQ